MVCGIDIDPWTLERARSDADLVLNGSSEDLEGSIAAWTRGRGVDAVLVTAATKSSAPMHQAAEIARDRATVVLVGDVGLELERRPLYEKELTVRVARSYGPGRYEHSYEELAVDYPVGQVRWTQGRNLEAVLDLLASGQLVVDDLITHRFDFGDVIQAYQLLNDRPEPYLGITLQYGGTREPLPSSPASIDVASTRGDGLGLIGAGAFARGVLVPALKSAGFEDLVAVTSSTGLSATAMVDAGTFKRVAPDVDDLLAETSIGVVAIATPHSSHAELVTKALSSGVDVWCEKPVALDYDELHAVTDTQRRSGRVLWIGLNRRFSPAIAKCVEVLGTQGSPLMISYRVHAGPVPSEHWYGDRREGGRLLGEVCHFVDTCAALVGTPVLSAYAISSGHDEALLDPDVTVLLRFTDGSQATIVYASGGHVTTPKERIEVLGRGHTVVIDDFKSVTIDGKSVQSGTQDKGHRACAAAFKKAVDTRERGASNAMLASSAATLAAAASLISGEATQPEPV
jgi:predicted dehydrogenase